MMTLGERLVLARKITGEALGLGRSLSQSELARRAGVSQQAISAIERSGDTNRAASKLPKIASGLSGVSWQWLATGHGDPENAAQAESSQQASHIQMPSTLDQNGDGDLIPDEIGDAWALDQIRQLLAAGDRKTALAMLDALGNKIKGELTLEEFKALRGTPQP